MFFILVFTQILTLGAQAQASHQRTPLLLELLNPIAEAVMATDNRRQIVYELKLSNASTAVVNLVKIEVLSDDASQVVLGSFSGAALLSRLQTLDGHPATNSDLGASSSRVFMVDLGLNADKEIPKKLVHRIQYLPQGANKENFAVQTYPYNPQPVAASRFVLGPPLAGSGWVAVNGCCAPGFAHRSSSMPLDGTLIFPQRFAIDWMRLDKKGRLFHGDKKQVKDYAGYGAEIFAVADGEVVSTDDSLNDQVPPSLPDPKTITIDNVLGNHVTIHLKNSNAYVMYAHLKKGSVRVKTGDKIKRGHVIGLLGNSGNTSAPHLHLQLLENSTLASNSLAYVFEKFDFQGAIPIEQADAFYSLDGSWKQFIQTPIAQQERLPLQLNIIDFGSP